MIEESVSIGTAYLRAGTLTRTFIGIIPGSYFNNTWTPALISTTRDWNSARIVEASNRSRSIHDELWTDAAAVAELKPTSVTTAYINSLNETMDLS